MVLKSSLSVECKGCKKQTNIVELFVRFEGSDAPTGCLFVGAERVREDENGAASNFELIAQVTLILPETERVKCFDYLAHGLHSG
jgi:hypothetical protein